MMLVYHADKSFIISELAPRGDPALFLQFRNFNNSI